MEKILKDKWSLSVLYRQVQEWHKEFQDIFGPNQQ